MMRKALIACLVVGSLVLRHGSVVSASEVSIASQADWKSGVLSGAEVESVPGELRLKTAGEWEQRAWQTPEMPLTVGTAVTSDGQNMYVLAGGDTWFGRYDQDNNKWQVLAPSPYMAYYGSDLTHVDGYIYAIFGGYQKMFARYNIALDSWEVLQDAPASIYRGGSLVSDGTYIYASRGGGTTDFWRYSIEEGSWNLATSTPVTLNQGASLAFYEGSLYTLRGGNTASFYQFSLASNTWSALANLPANINDDTTIEVVGREIFVLLNNNTKTFYKYSIADNTWQTLSETPQTNRYVGLVYNEADGYMYVIRGNNTYDIYKYRIAEDSFVGPADLMAAPGSGADLVYYDGYLYQPRGANTTSFYRYSVTTNQWESLANAPFTFNDDTTGVVAQGKLYFFRGSGLTDYASYDPTTNVWTTLASSLVAVRYGGSLAYAGGDYIYATVGNYNYKFYTYSISGDSWSDDPIDLPAGTHASYGARLVSDGVDFYYLSGVRTGMLLKYTVSTGEWSYVAMLPYAPYWGTDAVFWNGNILVQAGYYKGDFWRYNIANNQWYFMPQLKEYYGWQAGAYNGGSLAIDQSTSTIYSIVGASILNMARMSLSDKDYLPTGSFRSESMDLSYVSSFGQVSLPDSDLPSGTSVSVETRTSSDRISWGEWSEVVGGVVASSANRYLQLKLTLNSDPNQLGTPVVKRVVVAYEGDVVAPSNPSSVVGKSAQVGGVNLVDGESYRYNYPYFSWAGASDSESGVGGYYVYFGEEALADPVALGSFQEEADYVVTKSLASGNYYLRVVTVDVAGNQSEALTLWSYEYEGVLASEIEFASEESLSDEAWLEQVELGSGGISLLGREGFWEQEALALAPAGVNYGSAMAYVESTAKLYVLRGSNTSSFYTYDLESNTWTTLANAPANITYGGEVVEGTDGYLYATPGGGSNAFWRYDTAQNTWDVAGATDSPMSFFYGSSLVFDGEQYIYALRGSSDDAFLRYDTSQDEWSNLADYDVGAPSEQPNNFIHYGGDLAYDPSGKIYAVQGSTYTGFAVYDIATDTWQRLAKTPMGVYQGGQIEYNASEDAVYLIPGWNKPFLYRYDVGEGSWNLEREAPLTLGLGASMRLVGSKLYIMRGVGSTQMYVFETTTKNWSVPRRGLMGTMFRGTDIMGFGSGAEVIAGDGDWLYILRGSDDNVFGRYNPKTAEVEQLPGMLGGVGLGASMTYDSVQGRIYATTSNLHDGWYFFDIANKSWSREELDPLPTIAGAGASIVFDGVRYIYYSRGSGTVSHYRFDPQADPGSRWSQIANAPAGVGAGAQMVYREGSIYIMRGNNVLPNALYRYDVAGNSWVTLSNLDNRVTTDGFMLSDGEDGLVLCRGGNSSDCYKFDLTTEQWQVLAPASGGVTTGGAAALASDGRIYAIFGAGTNSYNNGLYSFVPETATSSFVSEGSYISKPVDLGEVYRLANLQIEVEEPANTRIVVETRSSSDGVAFGAWTVASEEKSLGAMREYKINSTVRKYLQVAFRLYSSDGLRSPKVTSWKVAYYSDTVAPSNVQTVSAYDTVSGSQELTSGQWYNYPTPHFDWPEPETEGGASDGVGGSAVVAYYVYFGTDPEVDPFESGQRVVASEFTPSNLVSGNSYYLRVVAVDDAGNLSSSPWEAFVYRFDNVAPSAPSAVAADPSGYSSVNEFGFSWDEVVDTQSGGVSYCYKTATASGELASDQCVETNTVSGITGYQTGTNTFMVRARDEAGNYSPYTSASYYFNNGAPSAPTSLSVSQTTNTVNAFEFAWQAPNAFYGSQANLKYYYSVNALPTEASVSRAYSNSLGSAPYATLPGENRLYVVVMDEAGNIDYESYASVSFFANTTAPGVVQDLDIADVSVKATSAWRLALSWDEPMSLGAGVASYQVFRSVDNETFSMRASTQGISYVDTQLLQQLYYYKVRACDSANNCGAFGEVVSLFPDGKYITPAPLLGTPSVSLVTTKKATIDWTTSRTADSRVSYGVESGEYFAEEVASSDQVVAHQLSLNNLTPGTKYYYVAKWSDEDGNLGVSEEYSFETSPAPGAKEVQVVSVGLDNALVQFTSSHASRAKVYYGTSSSFGGYTEVGVGEMEASYSVQLTGLLDGTKYYYRISLLDSEGNEYEGDIYSFETLPKPRLETIKLQQVKGTASGTVLVTWSSNTPVSSVVSYYPSSNPGALQDKISLKLVSAHRVLIDGLLPNTAYTLVVKGRDKAGNEALGATQTFTTATDSRPPLIANLKVEPVIQGVGEEAVVQLVVSWDTDELSSSQVAYGEGASGPLANKTQFDGALTYNHMVVIPNLSPGKVYHLRALSKDEAENEALSIDRVVITPTATKSALNLVIDNLSQAFGFLNNISGGQQ